ncbi:MAG: hypothetical protein HY347_11470 [candidate division NC10 bacterium]|nr:hypothetical protein [candidate division NC10 bacterium]
MWEGLEQLIQLQQLDLVIGKKDVAAKAIPAQIQSLEEDLKRAKAALDKAKTQADMLQKERRDKERVLEDLTQNLKKRQARLFEVKKNEEYTAVLKEIEVHREKISVLEEEILILFDKIEEAGRILKAAEAEFKREEAEFQRARATKEAELMALEGDLVALQRTRQARARAVAASLYQTYTRLLKSRGGLAVAEVKVERRKVKALGSSEDREETVASCSGCYVALPPQAYNEVRRNERLMTCENCQRILYYKG